MSLSTQPQPSRFRHIQRIHFIGIGGIGMSGIAEVLINQGYQVSGSDLSMSPVTQRLEQLGATIHYGHEPEYIEGAHVIVISSAIQENNPEFIAAKKSKIPTLRRAEMLAELMRFHYGIAIAGTHGKTTTTSLVATLLTEGGLDPTYVIGGQPLRTGEHARLGASPYFVVEADESDASFLYLQPSVAVVTNIDVDHMETYGGNFLKLRSTFAEFLYHLPFYGLAILCLDDPNTASLIPEIARPILTYGFHEQAQYRAVDYRVENVQSHFRVIRPAPHPPLEVIFNMPGKHNVQNALAAIAIATEHQIADEVICKALAEFSGVGRRLHQLGQIQLPQGGSALIVDDYGHHPRELEASWSAIREAWPDQRLVVIFQPHRYSRTAALWQEFSTALSKADHLFLAEIYPAGEQPIDGISSQLLMELTAQKTNKPCALIDLEQLNTELLAQLQDRDIVLMQGAGSISRHAKAFVKTQLDADK